MGSTEDADMLALIAAAPELATPDDVNKRFHDLLGGVWYYRAPDALKARLEALVGQNRW
jgi:hypothetical protein